MKLLVTGLSGLIGSRLRAMFAKTHELVGIDHAAGYDIANPADIERFFGRNFPVGDVKPDAVVHLAAFTNVSAAYKQTGDESGECFQTNVIGTRNIAQACAERGLRLIHISTDFVFDGTKTTPYTETDTPNPIEWYGQTKLLAETEARAAPDHTILRVSYPYTADPAPRLDLVRTLRNKLAAGEILTLFDDQTITPTWIDDIARGIVAVAKHGAPSELFHLTGPDSLSPYELGLKLAAEFGFEAMRIHPSGLEDYLKADPRPRQRRLRMSNEKWARYAAKCHLPAPLGIDEGLRLVHEGSA